MSRQLQARIASLKLCAGCAFILCVLGFTQHQDAAADQAARAHVEQQRKGEVAK